MSSDPNASPVNPLPPLVVVLFLAIVLIEAAFSLGEQGMIGGASAVGWRLWAMQTYAFSGEIFDWMWQTGQWPPEHLMRFVTYGFVHASLVHAAFAGVILLAMGKMVAEAFGQWRMLLIFVLSGAGAALIYAVLLDDPVPLIGAFPSVYGLIGGFTYLLWRNLEQMGQNQYRAFTLIGFLMAFQLIFGLLFGGQNDWIADVAGFVVGFALSFVLSPGGWSRMRDQIRHD
ncbi:MAG: rhomboid family intramembrane serine protease [Aestuariivita sp.]|uniref:rhomboid family intramembrane serine protease n=1 Tax=Aestuariivita sp. TaxID=1872407 RepID=UPI003BAF185E